LTAPDLDFLDLEDVVGCPCDTQQAANNNNYDLNGIAHCGVAAGAAGNTLEMFQTLVNFEHE